MPAHNAPVAQLDRVSVSEAEGRPFESGRARHRHKGLAITLSLFIFDCSQFCILRHNPGRSFREMLRRQVSISPHHVRRLLATYFGDVKFSYGDSAQEWLTELLVGGGAGVRGAALNACESA